MTLVVQIGAQDIGPGSGDATTTLIAAPGGAGQAGTAQVGVVKAAGGGYAFLPKAVVSVFDKVAGGTYGRRFRTFAGGYLDRPKEQEEAGTGNARWALDVTDFNCQLQALVTDAAWGTALHLSAGSYADQVTAAVTYFATGADNPIDGISGVLDLFAPLVLPAIVYPDMTLGEVIQDIGDRAVALSPGTTVVPRFVIRPDNTPNTLILDPDFPLGQPILYTWDGGTPPGPVMAFSDNPSGAERTISAVEVPSRLLDSAGLVQHRDLTVPGTPLIYSSTLAASVAVYPNPANGRTDHAWRGKSIRAPQYLAAPDAQAYLDGQVAKTGYPIETLTLTTDDAEDRPPLPGDTVTVTWALLGLSTVLYEVAATSYHFWWDHTTGLRIRVKLTLGLAQRALGQPGRFGGARAPSIAVPPDVPQNLTLAATVFIPEDGNSEIALVWDEPDNMAGIVGWRVTITTGGAEYHYAVDSPLLRTLQRRGNPGQAFTATVASHGINGLYSEESTPITDNWADAYAPDAPHTLTLLRSGVDSSGKAWAHVGFTPGGTTHGPHDRYDGRRITGGQEVHAFAPDGATYMVFSNLTPHVTYAVDMRAVADPNWPGLYSSDPAGVNETPLSVRVDGNPPGQSGGGGAPAEDQPLYPYEQTAGTLVAVVDPGTPYEGAAVYKLTSAGADAVDLTQVRFATAGGQVWTVRAAAKKSGGSPTLTGEMQWSANGTTWNVLTASTLTLPSIPGAWPTGYTEQQVMAPSTALFGRLVYTVTFAAALTVLLSAPAPTPAKGTADLFLASANFQDPATGAVLSTVAVDTVTGTLTVSNVNSPTDTALVGTSDDGTGVLGLTDIGIGVQGQATGTGAVGVSGTATGSGAFGVVGGSTQSISGFFQSQGTSNTASTVVAQQASTATGHLFEARGGGGADLWHITSAGEDVHNAGERHHLTSVSANTTLDVTHHTLLVDASGGAKTITLPAASGIGGREYTVVKVDSSGNAVTVARAGSDTIIGATTYSLPAQYNSVTIESDGTSAWYVTGGH